MLKGLVRRVRTAFRSVVDLMTGSRLYRWSAMISAVLAAACFALPIWRILPLGKTHPFIPLHYNVYLGVDRFGPWYSVFTLPALGIALLFVNIIFEAVFFRREPILSTFFAIATVFSETVLLVAMILIVLLNL